LFKKKQKVKRNNQITRKRKKEKDLNKHCKDRINYHRVYQMSKIIIVDPQVSGISGDMLLSSLVDSGADKNKVIKNINKIQKHFPDAKINRTDFVRTESNGIKATKFIFDFEEKVKEKYASDVYRIISNCCHNIGLSEKAKKFAI
jgi:uncharacterized protein (DUF111 family)